MLNRLVRFITTDIWRIRVGDLPSRKSFLIRQLRIVLLAVQGFDEDKCLLRASALTFYALLSLVPLAALAFAVAKNFGLEKVLERQLLERFAGQEAVFERVFAFARALLENTRSGLVAGIGVVILLWSVLQLLSHLEYAFNEIWERKRARRWWRKFSDYFAVTVLSPLLLLFAGSVTVFIRTQLAGEAANPALVGLVSPLLWLVLKLAPFLVIWGLFTFVYIVMPNTRVNFASGLLAGVVAGTCYQVFQWAYISFQVVIARHNVVYGSFAALPLFLVWLQLSWLILLIGAEIAFAHQSVDTYEFEPDRRNASTAFTRRLALLIARQVVRNFADGGPPLTASAISHTLETPIRLVRQLLFALTAAAILVEVDSAQDKEAAYQPARDIHTLSVHAVLEALDHSGSDAIHVAPSADLDAIAAALESFGRLTRQSPANRLLKDL